MHLASSPRMNTACYSDGLPSIKLVSQPQYVRITHVSDEVRLARQGPVYGVLGRRWAQL